MNSTVPVTCTFTNFVHVVRSPSQRYVEFAGLTGVKSRVVWFTVDSFTVLIFELVSGGLKYI